MIKVWLTSAALLILLLSSCTPQLSPGTLNEYVDPPKKEWTFIVYMAADNNLESAAIQDMNEMEAANLSDAPINILVLMDRAVGNDSTNDDWTDTRLYKVTADAAGANGVIVSKRIACPQLGITTTGNTELNMADPLTLSYLLTFAQSTYPADNYGLVVWGHGTGWRSSGTGEKSSVEPVKAIAIDDTSGKYMPISAFNGAIAGKGLSVIGFDTCFGALLEVAYEIKDSASWFVGSEGITPESGWNYTNLFNQFLAGDRTASVFCDEVINQFRIQYIGLPKMTISKIDLTKINSLQNSFEIFAGALAQCIESVATRDLIWESLITNIDVYNSTPPSDLYADAYSFTEKMIADRDTLTDDVAFSNNLALTGANLLAEINETVVSSWSYDGGYAKKRIGVNVVPIDSGMVPHTSHALGYIKGSTSMEHSQFVLNSTHWVPNNIPVATSFLDKMFYVSF